MDVASWLAVGIQFLILLGGVVWFQARQSKAGEYTFDDLKDIDKVLSDHLKDREPHRECAAHSICIENVAKALDRIEKNLGDLDKRVYDRIVRGGI
jgi:hypothetical protein